MRNRNNEDYSKLLEANVYDVDRDKLGEVKEVYLDDNTQQPTFAKVKTGFFGGHSLIPIKFAEWTDDNELYVPFQKSFVKDAPDVDADRHITAEEEQTLYDYYNGADVHEGWFDDRYNRDDDRVDGVTDVDGRDNTVRDGERGVGYDRDRVGDDDSMVVREEQLNVGTETVSRGTARLEKTVVSDTETVEVPVEREEVHVVHEPINERVDDDTELGDDEVTVTLHEERPVVEKETVAVERVGLNVDRVDDTVPVSEEVAREEVDVVSDDRDDRFPERDSGLDLSDRDNDGDRFNDPDVNVRDGEVRDRHLHEGRLDLTDKDNDGKRLNDHDV